MYRQMRYFIAVVETGSFFEAGEVCHISQSAISQQIKTLEEELQVQLLERHGRKFTVTPAGRYFYEQAKKQVQALDSAVREVRCIASGEYQRLRVGVLNGFSSRIVQKTVESFTSSVIFTGSFPHAGYYSPAFRVRQRRRQCVHQSAAFPAGRRTSGSSRRLG